MTDERAAERPRADIGGGYNAMEALPDRLSALLRLALDELIATSVRSIRSMMARPTSADTVPSQAAPSTICTAFAALLARVTGGMSDLRGRGTVGPAKRRRRATAGARRYTLVWRLTKAELATFEAFYQADLEDGTLSFTMPKPRFAGTGTFAFVAEYDVAPASAQTWDVTTVPEELPQ